MQAEHCLAEDVGARQASSYACGHHVADACMPCWQISSCKINKATSKSHCLYWDVLVPALDNQQEGDILR
jgi:hypothetical protein